MPRRKRTFIDRSRAKTFQLVHGSDDRPSQQVFVPQDETASPSSGPSSQQVISAAEFHASYDQNSYELGEYGFPADGYNYSQHFRVIGGGGGVYMDAVTGKPKPEAVSSSSARRNEKDSVLRKESVVLRDSFAADDDEPHVAPESWRNPEDVESSRQAIEDIKRDRRINKDIDAVIAALDTDGELELSTSEVDAESNAETLDSTIQDTLEDDSDLLDDDFITAANGATEDTGYDADAGVRILDGVVEEYREPRLLDAKFEQFMQGFELDSTDEEEEELKAELLEQKERTEEFAAIFQENGVDEFWEEEEELLHDLSGLQIDEAETQGNTDHHSADQDNEGEDLESEKAREFRTLQEAEFERGMTGLLDSYKRVSADDAFAAVDGLRGAREAITRAEDEEKDLIELENTLGGHESDGHDSELDSHFDELYQGKEQQWDCETIISTYSNLENHPSVIDAPASIKRRSVKAQPIIRLDPRTQAPAEFMPEVGAGRLYGETADYGSKRTKVANSVRTKGESAEEKRARKAAVKEAARERRALKSEMKKAFGAENVKQSKHATALGTSKVTMKF